MNDLMRFLLLSDPNTQYVVVGSLLLTASAALVGTFSFLRKRALVGDAVAHSVLPGLCLAFLLQGEKNPWILLVGATATGWLSLQLVDWLPRRTLVKEDTAIGLVLSVFFGIGILLLTAIQHGGDGSQSGLDKFLFGNAAAITPSTLWSFGGVAGLLVALVLLLRKELTLISFDPTLAAVLGFPVRALELVLSVLTVLAVVVGIQAVGVVLMAAMLITPAVAARQLTHRVSWLLVFAVGIGMVSGYFGALVSYLVPEMPTGPWMVLVASALALAALTFGPRGIVVRMRRQRQIRQKMLSENILKTLYHLDERVQLPLSAHPTVDVSARHAALHGRYLDSGLHRLRRQGLVASVAERWQLTPAGQEAARQVVRRHRLWEAYLANQLHLPSDHVHEDAETLEHLLTPELEAELEAILGRPDVDPHNEHIPYR